MAALLDTTELGSLLEAIGPLKWYNVSEVGLHVAFAEHEVMRGYADYVTALQRGELPDIPRALFSAALSLSDEAFDTLVVPGRGQLLRPTQPVIQLRPHTVAYSPLDGKVRSQVRGSDAISWGIQFGYPQLMQGESGEITKVGLDYRNTAPFRKLQRWMRHHTRATPLVVGGHRVYATARLGKACFDWIGRHPQLKAQGIEVGT